ncbi:MAG: hypothetical protein KTR29_23735 [Rhodothermaceae bacterium]|nr:hypothetical protein [Rhodothermaceae bacterium]
MKQTIVIALLFVLAGCAETAFLEPEPQQTENEIRKGEHRKTARFSRSAKESGLGVPFRTYADIPDSLSETILTRLQDKFPNGELAAHDHNTHRRYTEEDFIKMAQELDSSVVTLEDAKRVYLEHRNYQKPKNADQIHGIGSGWWTLNFDDTFDAYYAEVLGDAYIGSRHLTTICYHHEYEICDSVMCEYQCENAGCIVDFTSGASQAMTIVEWDAGVFSLGFRFPPTLVINNFETVNYTFWPYGAKYP